MTGGDFLISKEDWFKVDFHIYYRYLENLTRFIDVEITKHQNNISETEKKLQSGEITPPTDPGQMPEELHFDYLQIDILDQCANMLLKSFFVAIYSVLEASLIEHCTQKERESISTVAPYRRTVTNMVGYLVDNHGLLMQRTNTNKEWMTIDNYRLLRNAIVHNEGKPVHPSLVMFISNTPNIKNDYMGIELSPEFCRTALGNIVDFLMKAMQI